MATMQTAMRHPRIGRSLLATRLGGGATSPAPPSGAMTARPNGRTSARVTASGAGSSDRSLTFRLPIDELSRYAGLTAFVTAVLAGAGMLATIAYLAAWQVPAPILRLDPLTAALRSEVVLYQLATTGLVLFGLAAVSRRFAPRPWAGRIALGAAVAFVAYLAVDAVNGGFVGPVGTLGGGVLLFVAHRRAWLSDRTIAILIVLIALASAAQTGYELGTGYRDGRAPRTLMALTTTSPVGGLAGTAIDEGAWRYEGLYLVFRDGEAIYVSLPGAGGAVWVVPATRISSVELLGSDR